MVVEIKVACKILFMKKITPLLIAAALAPLLAFAQEQPAPQPTPQPASDVVAPPVPLPTPNPDGRRRTPPPPQDDQDKEDRRDFIDPQELQQVRRQIKELTSELKRIERQAQKGGLQKFVDEIRTLANEVAELTAKINSPGLTREVLQDFYDAQFWERLNEFRLKIEAPKELARIEKDLKRLPKFLARLQKVQLAGLDLSRLQSVADELRARVDAAKAAIAAGDFEEASEHLRDIHDSELGPGDIMGIAQRLPEIARMLKNIRDASMRAEVLDVLSPIFAAINDGEFREANFMLNDFMNEFGRLMQYARSAPKVNDEFFKKLRALEDRIRQSEERFEEQSQNQPRLQGYRYEPYRPGTLMGNLYYGFLDLLGL